MTDNEMRIAIAEACGTRLEHDSQWIRPRRNPNMPDYLNDLNAMHEAEKVLTVDQQDTFWCQLRHIVDAGLDDMQHCFNTAHATARQRAEAFLMAKVNCKKPLIK